MADFLLHALLGLSGKVLNVPGRDDLHDSPGKVSCRAGNIQGFADAHQLDAELLQFALGYNMLIVITSKAVKFVDKDYVKLLPSSCRHHLFKCRPYFTRPRAFIAIVKLSDHIPAVNLGVIAAGLQLGRNGKISTSLLIRGDPGIDAASLVLTVYLFDHRITRKLDDYDS